MVSTSVTAAEPTPTIRASPFAAFSVALAAAVVLDQLWWGGFEVASLHGLAVLAAFAVLARPGSVLGVAALAGAETVSTAADMPAVGSHRVLALVCCVTILAWLAAAGLRERRLPDAGATFAGLAGFLRTALIVVYLASALAKLNLTFLDPATSCAIPMARQLAGPSVPPALLDAAIPATIAAEAGLPLLLALRRTRAAGVVLGTAFHVVLALAGNVPFSAWVLPLYVAFLPARLRVPRRPRYSGLAVFAVLAGGWLAGAALGPSDPSPGLTAPPSGLVSPAVGLLATLVYLALAALLVTAVVGSSRGPGAFPVGPGGWTRAVPALGAALLVVNALCPYLGLKTDTSFEMFSGLRTEPGAWNHLLLPQAVRVFGLQDHAVTVVAGEPALVGRHVVPLELDRALRARPGAVAVVVTDGDPVSHVVGPRPPGTSVAQWALTFRDLPPPGVPRC